MNWAVRIALFVITALAIILVVALIRVQVQEAKKSEASSTAASMTAELGRFGNQLVPTSSLTDNWRILTGAEYVSVMSVLLKSQTLDYIHKEEESNCVLDPWKQGFLIAVRMNESGHVEFIVWSKGPDRVSGTSDDVISPLGAEVPGALLGNIGNIHDE